MKGLLIASLISFLGSSVLAANNNPWMRVCRIELGQFQLVQADSTQYALCFFGNRALGAEALFMFKSNISEPQAVTAYKQRQVSYAKGGVCGAFGADLLEGVNPATGNSLNICRFPDNSLIEEATLWLGPGTTDSEAFDKALANTYKE